MFAAFVLHYLKKLLMKKLLLLALPALFIFASCKRTGSPGHFISASSSTTGAFSSTGSSIFTTGATGAKIIIEGTSSSGAKMQIIINPYAGTTGTIALVMDTVTETVCQYTPASGSPIVVSAHGTVTLTSVTPDIIGSFAFTGRDSSINTGTFNAPTP